MRRDGKCPSTLPEVEPGTSRLVAQGLNQLRHRSTPLTGDITRIRKYLQLENFANAKLKRRKGAKYEGLEEAMEIWLGKRTAYDIIMDRNYFKVMYEASP